MDLSGDRIGLGDGGRWWLVHLCPAPDVDGGVQLHVLTCARADVAHFSYLGNGWTDCAEIWCVVRDPLARRFTEVYAGVHRARADVPLLYLGIGWTD